MPLGRGNLKNEYHFQPNLDLHWLHDLYLDLDPEVELLPYTTRGLKGDGLAPWSSYRAQVDYGRKEVARVYIGHGSSGTMVVLWAEKRD
ncbi:hypothetical protein MLD38_025997 [Melastoma candidum]|uniref:Uncharacterized protein n=1 Tax=Melastoma candidum TaxID=119954 RepID=A0ACB9NYK4_9MYRT|nr:hypothetical protein MLD38_025997 [Melastoma candidum]